MLSTVQWMFLGLILPWTNAFQSSVIHVPHSPVHDPQSSSITICKSEEIDTWPTPSIHTSSDAMIGTTTAIQVQPPMHTSIVPTTSTECFNSTFTTSIIVSIIETQWLTTSLTTSFTVTNTTTDIIKDTTTETTTVTNTTTDIIKDTVTDTTTETITDTTTATNTITVPTTITEAPNPCPTTCSMSVGTVNLFYWPTNQPHHVYPSTYVHSHLSQTFTSPSVYMIVDYLYGYNTAGRAGPSGTSVVFPLDLDQVSTIDLTNSATRQLTLNDLGTNCPQTQAPASIQTPAPNGHCDPILVAPEPVKSWASPCNACGNFGLFDPPYAVEPLTGGLVPVTTTVATTSAVQTSPSSTFISTTESTTTPVDSTTVAAITQYTSTSEDITSRVVETTSSQTRVSSSAMILTPESSSTSLAVTSPSSSPVSNPATTSPAYNSAAKRGCLGPSLMLSLFALVYLL
ncbi:hypothetical protein N7475_006971 [Penicillium sp. IBT 31633x]|nr:hypothetical protein N7475_006971 [Penicillium sp. IBT 31633x]